MSDDQPERLRLVESVVTVADADGVRLIRGHEVLRVRGEAASLFTDVERLRTGLSREEAAAGQPRSVLRQLVARLGSMGWLAGHDPEYGRGTPIERQIGYLTLFGSDAAAMQQRISKARVAVLGVGAVGGIVAQHLAGAGVGELWLIDHDRLSLHNLNRQFLGGRQDVGRAKIDVAADSLTRLAPGLRIHPLDLRVASPTDLQQLTGPVHLLMVAADTPSNIVDIAWQWARSRGVPVCTAAVGLGVGFWGPLLVPDRGHCWECFEAGRRSLLSTEEAAAEEAADRPTPYSFGPANTAVSALCAQELLRFLAVGTCAVLNRRGHIRFADSRTSFLEGSACTCRTVLRETAADSPRPTTEQQH
ncbi:ThiF family adenylyltransferase [Kitasatospora sp. NPDC059571]|uniref:ThiF family adenylyltransferase n=1 Tax=Kitasatospora sp. NPDC059571 TaxID=3346871 RepID=UPI003675EC17